MKKSKQRTNTAKENKPIDIFQKSNQEIDENIDEWKQNTDRSFLTDMPNFSNHQKYRITGRSRMSTSSSIIEVQNKKIQSQIQILKQQAIFLDNQIFNDKKSEYMNAYPICKNKDFDIKNNNYMRTSNNKFFKGQERRSILQNKRDQIKSIRKVDFSKHHISLDKNTKSFKTNYFQQICQINKPIIVYPFMDSIFQQQLKQRLTTSIISGKRQLKNQRYRSISTYFIQSLGIKENKTKNTRNWKNKIHFYHEKHQQNNLFKDQQKKI